jgi:hypothetical protein
MAGMEEVGVYNRFREKADAREMVRRPRGSQVSLRTRQSPLGKRFGASDSALSRVLMVGRIYLSARSTAL